MRRSRSRAHAAAEVSSCADVAPGGRRCAWRRRLRRVCVRAREQRRVGRACRAHAAEQPVRGGCAARLASRALRCASALARAVASSGPRRPGAAAVREPASAARRAGARLAARVGAGSPCARAFDPREARSAPGARERPRRVAQPSRAAAPPGAARVAGAMVRPRLAFAAPRLESTALTRAALRPGCRCRRPLRAPAPPTSPCWSAPPRAAARAARSPAWALQSPLQRCSQGQRSPARQAGGAWRAAGPRGRSWLRSFRPASQQRRSWRSAAQLTPLPQSQRCRPRAWRSRTRASRRRRSCCAASLCASTSWAKASPYGPCTPLFLALSPYRPA